MRAVSIIWAGMKRLIESFLHNGCANINVVRLKSSEVEAVKCCQNTWNNGATSGPVCERNGQQKGRDGLENRGQKGRDERCVTLPYARAVLHETRVVTILPE